MLDVVQRAIFGTHEWAPWTMAGGADPDVEDEQRERCHVLLTDSNLLTCFRRAFPERENVDYDEMVRLLDYVWDCPHDATANMTGCRCATCGRTRAGACR
jgi:hypothetical protein